MYAAGAVKGNEGKRGSGTKWEIWWPEACRETGTESKFERREPLLTHGQSSPVWIVLTPEE